ncbi:type I restriction enzyme HsdR N-terminal domain-containing protein [Tenacibaculum finnmarkense genomovar finnmarkense]|uniref:Restriction endonuclease type I HsdR N-terminal domain-containing protein n=2 Tax=Tenacibaculum finnmarkense TaxID=2781243 RepID=A0A2I2M9W2_9FLAO|nr:type I restriction endonuclease [Tenacibaculum finnmarkense]MCD8414323.1 type I restriction enzyme HsdR N-terminal domain-containing protein [Tenacibaculum dicentrarchi]MBE7644767.1 restriction endonuclease [Tenacibaculum finnmarkense genomovar ulcerans]MBE7651984.1 restriction endonuclease [Tenacibaculum finnmarkense genomovar finnmarkense]MBE7691723.1 restriction endonuclease [Tenacibaculum finnmarkense genomovar finnmarkense]MBE7694301.1 restriction endonuclease [Tenacibaculum finnmarken
MELHNQLKELAEKVLLLKDKIETEESTKHAFTLPFINILGYDAFNPLEVVPEFTADLGLKKGEKVDYAIFQNGEPILIVECKNWKQDLNVHNSQLFRYFHVTKTRFALLTNGIIYRFYTDLDASNKMDEKPFLEFDITNIKESTSKEIEKFHKSKFDVSKIVSNASNLKYTREIKNLIDIELKAPSNEFVKLFANKAYSGRLHASIMEEFKEIVGKAFTQIISEKVNDRLNSALTKEVEKQKIEEEEIEEEPKSKIETTEEEMEAYRIVVAILRRKLKTSRIVFRDTQSYFGILLDDNNRKPICRLHLNGINKYISVFNEDKKGTKIPIETIDAIYDFEKQLLKTVENYDVELV